MEKEDVTEWEFAKEYLDGWEHWTMLLACTWFKEYITRWRLELELKITARSLAELKSVASGTSKNSYYANKFLVEKGWKTESPGSVRGRGRPKKTQDPVMLDLTEQEAKKRVKDDFERLMN